MDQPLTDGLTMRNWALGIVATFVASAVAYLFGRKQSNANTKNTEADTAKTWAETGQIESTTLRTQGEIMMALIKEAGNQAMRAQRLNEERDHWESKAKTWEERAGKLQVQVELQEQQIDAFIKPKA